MALTAGCGVQVDRQLREGGGGVPASLCALHPLPGLL